MQRLAAPEEHRRAARPYFDAGYYLEANPDLRAAPIDPLDHFLLQGWREGRDPSPAFGVVHYLGRNPDVAAAGVNPLLHYAWTGNGEGRAPCAPLAAERRCLSAASPPSARVADWAGAADGSVPGSADALAAAIAAMAHPCGLVVSISHDDYLAHCGGVQNAIADEAQALHGFGWGYLHVSPAAPLPLLATLAEESAFRVRIRLDGVAHGVVTMQDLHSVLSGLDLRGAGLELVVHHLMGHAPELVTALARALGVRPLVWVHDFFTLCPSYALMRNDVRFCGGPPPGSGACQVCVYGRDRMDHLSRIREFFDRTGPLVLAPSAPALDVWASRGGYRNAGSAVVPLGRLLLGETEPTDLAMEAPLRIAHLGTRTMHKGWTVFEALALRFAGDPRYAFYQLGATAGQPASSTIEYVPIQVRPAERERMTEAIAEYRIDVALIWSLWPETFCFTAHEALAAGAFVLARNDAGNIGPAVHAHAPGQGLGVPDEAALVRLFDSGEIRAIATRAGRRRGAFVPSGAAARWIGGLAPAHG